MTTMMNEISNKQHQRKVFRQISGMLLLDKPLGITSNAALQRVKHLYEAAKAGHTGSLDPLATGMLPICFGTATRFSQFLLDADKRYLVSCRLGVTTTTDDAEGDIVSTKPCENITQATIESVLQKFRGNLNQLPPMHSAIKLNGQPLYKLARQGITVERQTRPITIYELSLVNFTENTLELMIHCSKGTYIRTLVGDIGKELECGAHITVLRRLAVGPYKEKDIVNIETLENLAKAKDFNKLDALLLPIESLLYSCPEIKLTDTTAYYLLQGQPVMVPQAPASGWVKLTTKDGKFLGAGEVMSDGKIAPRKLVKNK